MGEQISHIHKITAVPIGQNWASFLTLSPAFRSPLSLERVSITYLIAVPTHCLPADGSSILLRNVLAHREANIVMRTSRLLYKTF